MCYVLLLVVLALTKNSERQQQLVDRAQGKLRSEFAHMCDRNQSEKCLTTNYKKEPILDDPALAWLRVQGSSLQSVKGPRLQLMLL